MATPAPFSTPGAPHPPHGVPSLRHVSESLAPKTLEQFSRQLADHMASQAAAGVEQQTIDAMLNGPAVAHTVPGVGLAQTPTVEQLLASIKAYRAQVITMPPGFHRDYVMHRLLEHEADTYWRNAAPLPLTHSDWEFTARPFLQPTIDPETKKPRR